MLNFVKIFAMRKNYTTGAEWEPRVGYSRAVRAGYIIEVSGTVASEAGKVVGIGDAYAQTRKILEIISSSISALGGTLEHVVRTRIYTTDISLWEDIGRAHSEVFAKILPATSMVEVAALISPDFLVEIEATAVIT